LRKSSRARGIWCLLRRMLRLFEYGNGILGMVLEFMEL
jgi:hypothetical protein